MIRDTVLATAATSSSHRNWKRWPEEFTLGGRIRALRPHGKAAFFEIEDGTGRLQVYARRDKLGDEAYERVRSLDVGDIVGVCGGAIPDPHQRAHHRGQANVAGC